MFDWFLAKIRIMIRNKRNDIHIKTGDNSPVTIGNAAFPINDTSKDDVEEIPHRTKGMVRVSGLGREGDNELMQVDYFVVASKDTFCVSFQKIARPLKSEKKYLVYVYSSNTFKRLQTYSNGCSSQHVQSIIKEINFGRKYKPTDWLNINDIEFNGDSG